jgi:uncharacterized protein (TIGR02145 family)
MRKLLLCAALMAVSFTSIAQVGIGTTTPDASAVLDIESTTKGFLPPRMNKGEMNNIAAVAGLVVYCTDCSPTGLYVNDGSMFNNASAPAPVNTVGATDVVSATGLVWMDRNLGATQVAASSTDADSYGDLYQWGRKTDGHQIRTSATTAGPVASGSEGGNFITNGTAPFDWLSSQDGNRWSTESSSHNPCPTGYRVPTDYELQAERNTWVTKNAAGAFASPLKFPLAGFRNYSDGTLNSVDSGGHYWSSTLSSTYARSLNFSSSSASLSNNFRAYGFSVRCIKD